MLRKRSVKNKIAAFLCTALAASLLWGNYAITLAAGNSDDNVGIEESVDSENASLIGGGYAASGQTSSMGYASVTYDETNGLVTSDANYILGSSDGYIWIGSYSGIFRYDGTNFEKIDYSEGLTSGRGLFEDSRGRIWVGTNDNGVVVIEGEEATWLTYKDGLSSSSIRVFTEDNDGNVYIGTTAGVCYAEPDLKIHIINDSRINEERILRLDRDVNGTIYGSTKDGKIFSIKNGLVHQCFNSEELGIRRATSILADPNKADYVYITTNESIMYYGRFGSRTNAMKRITVSPIVGIHWINYDCGRIWVSSINQLGYLDEEDRFHLVDKLSMSSGFEMVTSDYQGNLWVASSTEGVMKIVSCNFIDLNKKANLTNEVANAICLMDGREYIGTDKGLCILDGESVVTNSLTKYISNARVRCLMKDSKDNLWVSTYNHGLGLVRYSKSGKINNFTASDRLPGNEIRCTYERKDGSLVVGTNQGLAIMKNDAVIRCIDTEQLKKSVVFLTAAETDDGTLLTGTDGDGMYIIKGSNIRQLGRDDGLTSDVVMRIKKDERRGLYWIITSNSIEYYKDGVITPVTSFPYNNNYDLFSGKDDRIWVISSYGICVADAEQMVEDKVEDYRLFTLANGLPSTPTSLSYNAMDDEGNMYISCRHGVCKVNIDRFFEEKMEVRATLKSVYSGDNRIIPDSQGRYIIPATDARVKINASVLDYTLVDPQVYIFMEGDKEDAVFVPKSKLTTLEYTGMKHGNYNLRLQVLAGSNTHAMLDQTFQIIKQPKFSDLLAVRLMSLFLLALFVGLVVFRVMKGTVVRRQYQEIKQARDDAERANSAKTRFLANISHEIRTPINTILGMDEMIMREDASNVPKGYFLAMMNYALDIKNATDSLLGLINDLLDISKIESGKMHLVEQEYDLQELLRSIVSMIRVKSTEKELTFDVVVDEIMPSKMYGDAGKIKQVVLNLLTNAVKYTEKGGFILMVALNERENDDVGISFTVRDTGIGVKEEDIDKLFTAYERLDEQKNSAIQGTGLGLDISRRFAELMGGSLTCTSVYGQGSDFVLSIHQKIVDDTPIGLFIEHDDTKAKGPYVPQFVAPDADVLVVDDNPMNLNVIRGLLKATKIFVTTADSGEECLEKMKTTKFNVVLLDHMMPGMDGIETVAKIRETDKDIPVYALTANASVGEDFYTSKGFTGYLSKPIDSEALEKAIMKHLPDEIMFKPSKADEEQELTEIPQDLGWLHEIPEITVDEGIKNSGGISSYIFSLKLFLDTIDGNARVISDAYEAGDIRLFTIKVHALKSSARIIGALPLSKLCQSLEDAGNNQDKEFIDLHTDELLRDYLEFKNKLSRLSDEGEEDHSDKMEISKAELEDAYGALIDVIPQMDYDSVELILKQLKEYKLPKEESEKFAELGRMLKAFDWEGMEELIKK